MGIESANRLALRGLHSKEVVYLLLTQQPSVRCPMFPKNSEEKLSMLLRLINGAVKRKVDSGLKMFIQPI